MMSLYDISDTIVGICNEISEVGIDSPEAQELFADLDEFYETRERKHESYVHVIRHNETMIEAMRAESQFFLKRARSLQALNTRLKERLMDDMRRHGQDTVDAGVFRIRIQQSAESVSIDVPAEMLAPQYQHVDVKPNKTAIKDALKAGEYIEGAELKRGEHLRIRAK